MFKKPIFKIVLIVLILALIIFAVKQCSSSQSNDIENLMQTQEDFGWKEISVPNDDIQDYVYDFRLQLNTDDMTLDGTLNFTYYNNNDTSMDELVFYLYANSYEKREYQAIYEEYFAYGYPNGFSAGSIDIHSVEIQGGGNHYITGIQNHMLVVELDDSVEPNESTEVKIEYTVFIPNSYGRFGYGTETVSIANCNPIMAVYDENEGYHDYYYNHIGDPFFSECADYSAEVTVPKGYIIAPTGTIEDSYENDDTVTYIVNGENRRDFAFVASDKFNVVSREINGVTINSYGFTSEKSNKNALRMAVNSIDVFSKVFGEYQYETFNVVETNFFIGGMEYPGMVMIDERFYSGFHDNVLEMLIAHEAAHQWWYSFVGNDQISEPWLDEALATFSERVYYEHVYPNSAQDMIFNQVDTSFISRNKEMSREYTRIDLDTLDYGEEYSLVVYGFGGWMIDDLRKELGEDVFYEAMHSYLEENMHGIATRDSLEKAIEETTGEDITAWFDENLQVRVGY